AYGFIRKTRALQHFQIHQLNLFRTAVRASGDLDAVLPMYPVLQAGKRFLQDSDTSEPPGPI
ncbi:MAG: hypothetical protein, partial [Olavius algarvensis Gamma 3 endosymbiont]